ncbi:MAG: type II secretion system minor pseudopilin GspI [Syntrophorhabdales bacterium]
MKRSRCDKGTTLLEVMVAMAIAAIALFSLYTLVVASLDMEEYARRMTSATLIADAKLKEIERTGYPELSRVEGLVDENDPTGFSYRTIVTETPIEDVRQVDVEVFWDKGRRSVTLTGYFAKK